mgnify:CR=1 FL=1
MRDLLILATTVIFVENIVLTQFLGICPFLGVSKKVSTAIGMGMAVTFVMTLASFMTYLCQIFLLIPLKIEYMQTMTFILIIASLVQFVEMFLQKSSPALYQALGICLPLITTNCAVLGVALLDIQEKYNLIQSIVHGFAGGLSFTLAIVLFARVRERLESANIPKPLRGFPIALISAALMSLAFMGFSGLKIG